MSELTRRSSQGVTLLGKSACPGGVAFAFTERAGGVSAGEWASLNLGDNCGDDAACVNENRRRALRALGAEGALSSLVAPRQVHGDHVVCVTDASPAALRAAQEEARLGADAVVCTAAEVPVLLCFADCLPVILTCEGGFAVVHSGWRGTLARIAAKAARMLCARAGCSARELRAYVGPHITGEDYEVSLELMGRFESEFGAVVRYSEQHLDLAAGVRRALQDAGVPTSGICDCGISTVRSADRFYSYRGEGGHCGRHGALAWMSPSKEASHA